MKKYNLIVAGGGFAGVAAAISGARLGLAVLIIEKSNNLGGAATNCLVNPFMPYWTNITVDGKKEKMNLSEGIFKEIVTNLHDMGAIDLANMVFQEEYLKLLLNRMVKKENIDILFHSYLIESKAEDKELKSITVANKSGNIQLEADYFIDCTGDADLAHLSGCPTKLGRDSDGFCQPMTLCFRAANVDIEKYKKIKSEIDKIYKEHQKAGKIKNIREDVLIFHNLVDGVLHFNSTRVVKKSPIDAFSVTEAEIDAREQVFELFNFLKDNIEGFENSQLIMTAAQIGVRESRKIEGVYKLTQEDLVACTKFEDSVAAGNYDIDIHNPTGSGTSHYYFKEGEYYTIPYRSLLPKDFNNLLVAGRCISATHEAQASIRIIPIVCCLGEAAGTAAAIACKDKLPAPEISIEKLKTQLEKQNCFI